MSSIFTRNRIDLLDIHKCSNDARTDSSIFTTDHNSSISKGLVSEKPKNQN